MKKAAALAYDQTQDKAPKVLAKGQLAIAEAIIAKAEELEIPIFKNEALVNALTQLELDTTIPPELYQATAEVFAWLASIDADHNPSKA